MPDLPQTTRPLSEDEQARILAQIKEATPTVTTYEQRPALLCGAILGLQVCNITIPPYWTINLMCGRTDRLFNQ